MHTVAVLALDRVVAFDFVTPMEVFSLTRLPDGRPGYRVIVCAATPDVESALFGIRAPYGLDALEQADTVIVPGTHEFSASVPDEILDALRKAAADGTRIASICAGALVLAKTGLLDGLRATTHWLAADRLAERHPDIEVDPNVLYVDNGQILTSAGAAAGLDLCLHMVRRDYGSAVAADTARLAVVPLEREGGQAQFIVHTKPPAPAGSAMEPLLRWMEDNCGRDLSLDDVAAEAGMSTRTLNRRFREQTGTTPLQWLQRSRVRRAQYLLESTTHSVERIAVQAGFGSPTAFRDRFKRTVGVSPQVYRRSFRAPEYPGP
ncbi:GlxA family transcriptional regulator [Yinghuangia sp. YIM S09857]|uniref:GlxA family transcriptional regulator n=1 Tax=Yinghuangia sp. YIM S09857 TaxID=3436929 RepID=UPI003F52C1E4